MQSDRIFFFFFKLTAAFAYSDIQVRLSSICRTRSTCLILRFFFQVFLKSFISQVKRFRNIFNKYCNVTLFTVTVTRLTSC